MTFIIWDMPEFMLVGRCCSVKLTDLVHNVVIGFSAKDSHTSRIEFLLAPEFVQACLNNSEWGSSDDWEAMHIGNRQLLRKSVGFLTWR